MKQTIGALPQVYDITRDHMRPVTQDDIDKLEEAGDWLGRFIRAARSDRENYVSGPAVKAVLAELSALRGW